MRLTKEIDLEELGYDYVLIDETKQPSANYKLGKYEDVDESPEHLSKVKQAFDVIKEKKVNVPSLITLFKSQTSYEDYEQLWDNDIRWQLTKNWDIQFSRKKLTREEYDLLIEMLRYE